MRSSLTARVPTHLDAPAAFAEEFAGHCLVRHPVPSQQNLQACAARRRTQRRRDDPPIAQFFHSDADLITAACRRDGVKQRGLNGAFGEESSVNLTHTTTIHRRTRG